MRKRIRQKESPGKNLKDKKKLQRKNYKTIESFILRRSIEAGEYHRSTGTFYSSFEYQR
jgi:hypothetical protein